MCKLQCEVLYHLVLGSKDGVAWNCAQTGEREAELMIQKSTL